MDGTYPRAVPDPGPTVEPRLTASFSDAASIGLYLLALVLIVTGAGILGGLGGAILAAGITILPAAILLGVGGDR